MPLSCRVMVASWCCFCPGPGPLAPAPAWPPSSLVASDRSGGAGFPPAPGSRDTEVAAAPAAAPPDEAEVARGGIFMLRTDSRMICRIVLRKALRNSPVL